MSVNLEKLSKDTVLRFYQLRVLSALDNLRQYVIDCPEVMNSIGLEHLLLNVYESLLRKIYGKSSTE